MEGRESRERHVAALAQRQHGVVTTRQLAAAGIGKAGIEHRVKHGRLVRLHRGVFQVGPVAAPRGREMAALLACGEDAALSHHSAAAVWGFRPEHEGDVHVTTTAQGRSRQGIQVHRTHSLKAAVDVRRRCPPDKRTGGHWGRPPRSKEAF